MVIVQVDGKPVELETLLEQRNEYKKNGNYEKADYIRNLIMKELGGVVEDSFQVDDNNQKVWKCEWISADQVEKRKKPVEVLKFKDNRSRRERNKRKRVHNQKQKGRFKAFANWVKSTFQFEENCNILDIAGGQGKLCWELVMDHNAIVTVVDPTPLRLSDFKKQKLLENSSSTTMNDQNEKEIDAGMDALDLFHRKGGKQMNCLFNDEFCENNEENVWTNANLVLGLHPDQATDFIVKCALKYKKPFAVVPCCVYPSQNQHRLLKSGKIVNTREELCQYYCEMNQDIKSIIEPTIPGPCNTIVYWKG